MSALASMKSWFDIATANKNVDYVVISKTRVHGLSAGDNSKTLSPNGPNLQGVQSWSYKGGGIALGYPTVSLLCRSPIKGSRLNKVTAKVVLPVLEQTSASTASGIQPAPTLAYSLQANLEFILPERASATEKNALLSMVSCLFAREVADSASANNLATASPVIDAVLSDERVY